MFKASVTKSGVLTDPVDVAEAQCVRLRRLGWRRRGGGGVHAVEPLPEVNGSSKQLAGVFPFHAKVSNQPTGIPLGRDPFGAPVLWDPVTAFRNDVIRNPSTIIIGSPGIGKSSCAQQYMEQLAARGVYPMLFGDTKSEHGALIEQLGGKVFRVGPNADKINVLDPGGMWATSKSITDEAKRNTFLGSAIANRLNLVAGLIEMNRGSALVDHETAILSRALRGLDEEFSSANQPPVLSDLVQLLETKPQYILDAAVTDGDPKVLAEILNPLRRSIIALAEGIYGDIFAHQTTTPLDLSKPLCIDISDVAGDETIRAVLWACWVEGFNSIQAVQAQQKPGAAKLNFLVVIDELWRILKAGKAMINRLDALVRLDRHLGVATMFITHGATDMEMVNSDDLAATEALVSKMGSYIVFGVSSKEFKVIKEYIGFNDTERDLLTSWKGGKNNKKGHGKGMALIKTGDEPGTQVKIMIPECRTKEKNTNSKWDMEDEQPKRLPASPVTPGSVPLPPVIRSRRVGPVDAQTTGPVPGVIRQRQPVDVTAPPLTPALPETVANIEPPKPVEASGPVESSGLVEASESLVESFEETDLLTPRPLRSGRVGFRAVSLLKRRVGIAAAPVEPLESLEELSTRVGLEKEEG